MHHAIDGREAKLRAKIVQRRLEPAIKNHGVDDSKQSLLEPFRAGCRESDVAHHALVGERADDTGLQMHRSARHAKLFLRDAGADGQTRESHHGTGIRVLFDQPVNFRDRRHDHLRNHFEALAQMPQLRIGDGGVGLGGAADGKKADSLSFDQRLKNRIGQNRRSMAASFERRAERDKRVHIARAAHGRQQHVKRELRSALGALYSPFELCRQND